MLVNSRKNEAPPRQFVTDFMGRSRLLHLGPRPSFRIMNSSLESLLETPVAKRDVAWEINLLRELPKSNVRIIEDTPVAGPDGWPYLMLASGGDEPLPEVARWLGSRGVGFVLNPEKSMPDFVVTYGMVWNFCQRGEFLTATPSSAAGANGATSGSAQKGKLEIADGQQLYTGAPSIAYLPEEARVIIREFFKRQKVTEPKVLMISTDQTNWDLAFSIESLGAPPANEHAGIAEALSWFLPAHYSVALVSEKTVPGFAAL